MSGFWAGIWSGSTRELRCPHCGKPQLVARRPTPFEVRCKSCRREFRVTDRGPVAFRPDPD